MNYVSVPMEDKLKAGFSITAYNRYGDVPLIELDKLPYSAYLVSYDWVYLFINKSGRQTFGVLAEDLIGKSARAVFTGEKFKAVFDKLDEGLQKKISIEAVLYSPMRNSNINVKGFPLEDCYYFSVAVLPGKQEVVDDLRSELRKRK
jgi:hypothetical protein